MTEQTQNQAQAESQTEAAPATLQIPEAKPAKEKKAKPDPKALSQEVLKAALELKDDGYFYYKEDTRFHLKGSFAGSIRAHDSYYSLTFGGCLYSGKMLAHFYKTGEWVDFTKGARLDENGNPIAKPKKEKVERTVRTPPVFTEEQKAQAKAEAAAKREAAKKKAEAEKAKSAPTTETNEASDNTATETKQSENNDEFFDLQ